VGFSICYHRVEDSNIYTYSHMLGCRGDERNRGGGGKTGWS
jgi:predicted GNAT superfamily acetyltransferase